MYLDSSSIARYEYQVESQDNEGSSDQKELTKFLGLPPGEQAEQLKTLINSGDIKKASTFFSKIDSFKDQAEVLQQMGPEKSAELIIGSDNSFIPAQVLSGIANTDDGPEFLKNLFKELSTSDDGIEVAGKIFQDWEVNSPITLKTTLSNMDPADAAKILAELPSDKVGDILNTLAETDPEKAAEILTEIHSLKNMGGNHEGNADKFVAEVIAHIAHKGSPKNAANILYHLPDEIGTNVLENLVTNKFDLAKTIITELVKVNKNDKNNSGSMKTAKLFTEMIKNDDSNAKNVADLLKKLIKSDHLEAAADVFYNMDDGAAAKTLKNLDTESGAELLNKIVEKYDHYGVEKISNIINYKEGEETDGNSQTFIISKTKAADLLNKLQELSSNNAEQVRENLVSIDSDRAIGIFNADNELTKDEFMSLDQDDQVAILNNLIGEGKYNAATKFLNELAQYPDMLYETLDLLDENTLVAFFDGITDETSKEFLNSLNPPDDASIITKISNSNVDLAADLLIELDPKKAAEILYNLDVETGAKILNSWAENSDLNLDKVADIFLKLENLAVNNHDCNPDEAESGTDKLVSLFSHENLESDNAATLLNGLIDSEKDNALNLATDIIYGMLEEDSSFEKAAKIFNSENLSTDNAASIIQNLIEDAEESEIDLIAKFISQIAEDGGGIERMGQIFSSDKISALTIANIFNSDEITVEIAAEILVKMGEYAQDGYNIDNLKNKTDHVISDMSSQKGMNIQTEIDNIEKTNDGTNDSSPLSQNEFLAKEPGPPAVHLNHLIEMDEYDKATEFLDMLAQDPDELYKTLNLLNEEKLVALFKGIPHETSTKLLNSLNPPDDASIITKISNSDVDLAADLLINLDPEKAAEILYNLDVETGAKILNSWAENADLNKVADIFLELANPELTNDDSNNIADETGTDKLVSLFSHENLEPDNAATLLTGLLDSPFEMDGDSNKPDGYPRSLQLFFLANDIVYGMLEENLNKAVDIFMNKNLSIDDAASLISELEDGFRFNIIAKFISDIAGKDGGIERMGQIFSSDKISASTIAKIFNSNEIAVEIAAHILVEMDEYANEEYDIDGYNNKTEHVISFIVYEKRMAIKDKIDEIETPNDGTNDSSPSNEEKRNAGIKKNILYLFEINQAKELGLLDEDDNPTPAGKAFDYNWRSEGRPTFDEMTLDELNSKAKNKGLITLNDDGSYEATPLGVVIGEMGNFEAPKKVGLVERKVPEGTGWKLTSAGEAVAAAGSLENALANGTIVYKDEDGVYQTTTTEERIIDLYSGGDQDPTIEAENAGLLDEEGNATPAGKAVDYVRRSERSTNLDEVIIPRAKELGLITQDPSGKYIATDLGIVIGEMGDFDAAEDVGLVESEEASEDKKGWKLTPAGKAVAEAGSVDAAMEENTITTGVDADGLPIYVLATDEMVPDEPVSTMY